MWMWMWMCMYLDADVDGGMDDAWMSNRQLSLS